MKTILDKTAKADVRISSIRSMRNYNNHRQVAQLLGVLKDTGDDLNVRICLTEALGWFNFSIKRAEIINALNSVYSDAATKPELKAEVMQSLNRLR